MEKDVLFSIFYENSKPHVFLLALQVFYLFF